MSTLANVVSVGNVYPTYESGLETLGIAATSPSSKSPSGAGGGTSTSAPAGPIENALNIGASGSPVVWWGALAVMLVALMYGAQKLGTDGEFGNLKLSAYNIFTISLASIIGINLFKLLFTKFPIPGLTTVVMSA